MVSKFDRLRSGEVVDLGDGLSGRLNLQDKHLELSNGRRIDASRDPDFFPADDKSLAYSREKEGVERDIQSSPFGEFGYQFGNQGAAGAAKNWVNKLTKTGEDYARSRQVNSQVSQDISERSPWTSAAATAASFAPDIAITKGMGGARAGVTLAGAHAGPRIIEEPGQVAAEAAIGGVAGHFIDKGAKFLSDTAQRRGQVRALPSQQQAVRDQNFLGQQATDQSNISGKQTISQANIAGKQATDNANLLNKQKVDATNQIGQNTVNQANQLQDQQFNLLKQNIKNSNEASLLHYEQELNLRKNTMIQEENEFLQKNLARNNEVLRLKNKAELDKVERNANASRSDAEYKRAKMAADQENKLASEKFKMDQNQYQQDLKRLPEMQKKAQKEYSENVVRNAEKISGAFPSDAKIYSSQFKTGEFIDEFIQKSGSGGSREASQASRVLKSIMPEGEILTGKDLANRYKALEGAIQKANPEVRQMLTEFKTHLGSRLEPILSDNMAYTRVMPVLKKQIESEVSSALNAMKFSNVGVSTKEFITSQSQVNLNKLFRELTPEQFIEKMHSGELKNLIMKNAMKPLDFKGSLGSSSSRKGISNITSEDLLRNGIHVPPPAHEIKHQEFISLFENKLDKALAKAQLKMIAVEHDAAKRLGSSVKRTFGTAEPVAAPNAPLAPSEVPYPSTPPEQPPLPTIQFPENVTPPTALPFPNKPTLLNQPIPPTAQKYTPHSHTPQQFTPQQFTPQQFSPQLEPTLPAAQGAAEGMGDLLEKNLMGGKGVVDNPIAKLAGLKYVLGKGALPLEAGYLGLKGLTSPTAAGEAARMTFKTGGIQAVNMWAQRYPSYHDGILESAQDRRSLTKEIENDPSIPIEQKAIMQSKVNRGKPIEGSF